MKKLKETRAMCPKQGLGSCQKYIQAQSERQGHILLARRKVFSQVPHQESRRRENLWLIPGRVAHGQREKDLNSAELETMWTSRSPTTVMTANGEVRTNKEATVCVKQLDLFVTVMLLQETPAVLSLEKLCEDHGYTYHWKRGQNPHLIKNGKRIDCKISNYVPFAVPGLSASSFFNYAFICLVTIFITGVNIG